jgi:hypothetical protein
MDASARINKPLEADGPWKEALEAYFPQFMAFFFPEAHGQIDWARDWAFLDKELEQIVRDAELGRRFVDKLVQVWSLEGEENWLLCHLEIVRRESRTLSATQLHY